MANVTIIRERVVEAPVEELWPYVDDVDKLAEWFSAAERIEALGGSGAGRRQRAHGRWGKKTFEVDQVVTQHQEPYLIAWEHESERLDGEPAPKLARSTRFEIRLIPRPEGAMVRLESVQEPVGPLKGAVIRLFGKREVARHMENSLRDLGEMFKDGTNPSSLR
ncbi:MAG: SRPBCC domain-containing protein [Actinomycetota bacterium]|nr:SRPBCC domain-containing protein [Actinomycetota bacterium]